MSNVIRVVSKQEAERERRRNEGPIARQVREQDEARTARRSREWQDAARSRTLGRLR